MEGGHQPIANEDDTRFIVFNGEIYNHREIREFLEKKGVKYVPSEANFFMMDVGRPHAEFASAMAANQVIVGRVWPVWPTKVRVSIGSDDEMARFKAAFEKVWG